MPVVARPVLLRGVTQPYAWGGDRYLAELLGRPPGQGPLAEYWLGAHPGGPAHLGHEDGARLDEFVAENPELWLGHVGIAEWPFLLKVLDVARPLSIQVHPDTDQARSGFAAEEAAGVPRGAPHRNFKDVHPKPELAVALEPFWLLFGLAPEELVARRLEAHDSLGPLRDRQRADGAAGTFAAMLEADDATIAAWVAPLLADAKLRPTNDPYDPAFWLARWQNDAHPDEVLDRGVLGFLLMNILCLPTGHGIFQGPGVPHAYLHGRIVELMTSSDNVLRCGLTPKHVDPQAVLAHVDLDCRAPTLVLPRLTPALGVYDYVCPVDDFRLARVDLDAGDRATLRADGPAILLILEGPAVLEVGDDPLALERGEAALLAPDTEVTLRAEQRTQAFLARQPRP